MFTLTTARLTEKSVKKTAVVFSESKARLTQAAEFVNISTNQAISSALRGTRYQGGMNEITRVTLNNHMVTQALVVGVGKLDKLEQRDWWRLGLSIGKNLDAIGVNEATIALGELADEETTFAAAKSLIEGIHMSLYRFDTFKSEQKEHQKPRFEKLAIHTSTRVARMIEDETPALEKLLSATNTTREAVNLPPNIANPEYMAEQARKLEKLGVKVEVIDEKQMKKLGMNLFLAVGGSAAPEDQPRLILMHYNGLGKTNEKPYAIVGKGVMFDTGGYNLKPSNYMGGMKFDMAGSAAVLGAMQALASRKAKVNVVGVMACAMNMVGQTPFVPDSIYKSYKGLFVEIGNTDAEGRLVLADAIAYTIEKYNPTHVVDLATLTGACMVALGGAYAGLFSNNKTLANSLHKAGEEVGERLWHMPADDVYAAKTKVADVNNDGSPYGGASTGAVFIKKFADKTPWAHLDIAGVANQDKVPGIPDAFSGATGFGVRLLVNWLENHAPAPLPESTSIKAKPKDPNAPKRGRGRPPKAR